MSLKTGSEQLWVVLLEARHCLGSGSCVMGAGPMGQRVGSPAQYLFPPYSHPPQFSPSLSLIGSTSVPGWSVPTSGPFLGPGRRCWELGVWSRCWLLAGPQDGLCCCTHQGTAGMCSFPCRKVQRGCLQKKPTITPCLDCPSLFPALGLEAEPGRVPAAGPRSSSGAAGHFGACLQPVRRCLAPDAWDQPPPCTGGRVRTMSVG